MATTRAVRHTAATVTPPPATPPARERLLTLPLLLFLTVVVGVLVVALLPHLRAPSPGEAIRLLADGDLDRAGRLPVLARLADEGPAAAAPAERWAAALAAIALRDRGRLDRALAALGGGAVPQPAPPAEQREFLDLGDPLLANVLAAWLAEADGDLAGAQRHWQQLAAQCRYTPHELCAELAATGAARTRER